MSKRTAQRLPKEIILPPLDDNFPCETLREISQFTRGQIVILVYNDAGLVNGAWLTIKNRDNVSIKTEIQELMGKFHGHARLCIRFTDSKIFPGSSDHTEELYDLFAKLQGNQGAISQYSI